MNDIDLYNKAAKAGYDYRTVHGCFPEKIGIHYKRLCQFHRDCIIFLERTPPEVNWFVPEKADLEAITFKQHRTRFEPVIGEHIRWDEVYLPVPNDPMDVISGEQIAYLAHREERAEQSRLREQQFRDRQQALVRTMEAGRKEEVNVCPECYRFYVPMRKLQEIYDPWFAPQCDYCEQLAKYHVHRSDWVGMEPVIHSKEQEQAWMKSWN
jgi:hypothetical protein